MFVIFFAVASALVLHGALRHGLGTRRALALALLAPDGAEAVRLVKAEIEEQKRKLQLSGGRLQGEMVVRGNELGIDVDGENSLEFSNGEMIFLDFEFQPTDKVSGQASLNILGNVADWRRLRRLRPFWPS